MPIYVEAPAPPAEPPSRRCSPHRRTTSCSATACRRSGSSDVRAGDEDALLRARRPSAAEAAEALLELATGGDAAGRRRRCRRRRPVRASRRAAPLPGHGERRGAGAGARLPVGEVDRLPAPGAAASWSSATTAARRASPARPAPARPSSPCTAPSTSPARTRGRVLLDDVLATLWRTRCATKLKRLIGNEPRLARADRGAFDRRASASGCTSCTSGAARRRLGRA